MTDQVARFEFVLRSGKTVGGVWSATITDDATTLTEITDVDGNSLGEALAGEEITNAIVKSPTVTYVAGITQAGKIVLPLPMGTEGRTGNIPPLIRPYKVKPSDQVMAKTCA